MAPRLSTFERILIVVLLAFTSLSCQEEIPPVAEFEADTTTVEQGSSVQFRDLSLDAPTEWSWRFEAGEPQVSTLQHPQITYHHSGEYEVRLSVSNEYGTDVMIKDNYISVLTPYPTAEFTAETTVTEINGIIRFTDLSTDKPAEWAWTFQGGNPETSTAQHPKVIYETPGVYSVVLTVKNDRGTDTEAKEDYITVLYPRTDLTFHNNVFTEVYLTLEGDTRAIPPGDSITIIDFEGFEAVYFAETSGKTAEGQIVGLAVYWVEKLELNGSSMDVDIDLSQDMFYLYITNNGSHDLAPLYVNYGSLDQTKDNVVMKADGKKYRTGYYRANPGTIIRADWIGSPTGYTLWANGTDFSFPFAMNQVVYLTNEARKKSETVMKEQSIGDQ